MVFTMEDSKMTIVIIGGDAAGMSASSRIARRAKDAHVIVYEKTDTISYGACGLPFYIGGLNNDINLVKILSPEQARKTVDSYLSTQRMRKLPRVLAVRRMGCVMQSPVTRIGQILFG